ncbi:MAG: glycosyltransferase N-terminal domain-containing protein [Bacteroidia bacterium]
MIIRIGALFNPKAKQWITGRKAQQVKWQTQDFKNAPVIWFHCASLGEFEQGRPVIEKIKAQHPAYKILLTFFSPSGYEIRNDYGGADYIFYLPLDTIANAKKIIEIVKPKVVFFVKYEFWFNYLNELKKNKIATYLISGIFRENQYFFKPYGFWFRKQLSCFTHFFIQDEESAKLLKSIKYTNATISGDTRFDRVAEITKNVKPIKVVQEFITNKKVFIAGSTWNEDEQIISTQNFKELGFKIIIAPHEIHEHRLAQLETNFAKYNCLRFSKANEQNVKIADLLIIDNIGTLSHLYQYGSFAFIGGGFGKGIHNILEAATFGLPVIFGPNYKKFTEAKQLIQFGGAFSVASSKQFNETIQLLMNNNKLQIAADVARKYVVEKTGAADIILSAIKLQ